MKRSHAHRRTRADHATETAEDYVEAVADFVSSQGSCRVKDLAGHFAISHVTVIRTVKRLMEEGLLSTEPRQPIELTAKGRRLARTAQERHRTVVAFLLAIGVSPKVAELDSEGIEHHLSAETLARFRAIADERPTKPD